MMAPRYIVRLDDACPTMSHSQWKKIENMLDEFSICPIVAVIPENKDPSMVFAEEDPYFWNRIRSWQNKGWEIALHGHTHVMRKTNVRQILPYYDRSEFSGLSYEEQKEKILKGISIFASHGIIPQIFVAPAHCFDQTTVDVLRCETSIRIISDGVALNIFQESGMHWIPQQLSRYSHKPFGLWTICLHPNTCTEMVYDEFRRALSEKRDQFISLKDLSFDKARRKSVIDYMYSYRFWNNRRQINSFT